jgi:hypothetical protein
MRESRLFRRRVECGREDYLYIACNYHVEMYRQEQCEKDPQLKLCVILLSIVTTGQSQFQKRGCRHQSGKRHVGVIVGGARNKRSWQ